MQYEFLNSPIQELRDIKNILGRARNLVNPSKLLELLAGFAEHAEDFSVEGELIDAPWVRVRGVQRLTRTGRDANRPRRAGRLGERRSCCFQLRNVRNRSDRGYRGRIEGHIDLDLSQQLALAVEYLDTPIAPVRDVDVALRIGGDAVRRIELARLVAGLGPRHKPFAILICFRHS